jgi:hypothetical protein
MGGATPTPLASSACSALQVDEVAAGTVGKGTYGVRWAGGTLIGASSTARVFLVGGGFYLEMKIINK